MIRAAIEPSPTAGYRGSGGSQEVEADEPAKAVVSVSNTEFTGNPPYSIWPYSVVSGRCQGSRIAKQLVPDRFGSVPGIASMSSLCGDAVLFAGVWPRWPKAFAAHVG